jgi:NAD(P)-dependent dehydrogenase (short-subunit alcohol dehydrogenase family)
MILENKVALVTGGTSGIGRATAIEQPADVGVNADYRSTDRTKRLSVSRHRHWNGCEQVGKGTKAATPLKTKGFD